MSEENLSAVTPAREPKQDKEALRARWNWVEHTVWTDPMLRTLETGIKGGEWYALIDKVQSHCRPHELESRMLENCLSGSEGGGASALPTPIIGRRPCLHDYLGQQYNRITNGAG